MSFKSINFDTKEQEAQALAEYPEGSDYHTLSKLPVLIDTWPHGKVVRLACQEEVVVVPYQYCGEPKHEAGNGTILRPRGHWKCIVVNENTSPYSQGCHIIVPHVEIIRSKEIVCG